MRKTHIVIGLAAICTIFTSCGPLAGVGGIAGTALGAITGGILGGRGGAVAGAAIGAYAGTCAGASLDIQERKAMEAKSPNTVVRMDRGEPLTVDDIIHLSEGGVSENRITKYIYDTQSTYNLNQMQIRRMQDAGVNQRIINYMIG